MPRNHASTLAVIDMIAAERIRQVEAEGFTHAHDDDHPRGELAVAAACYAMTAGKAAGHETRFRVALGPAYLQSPMPADWPWALDWWKPKSPVQDLIRAGALIVAEIERRLRLDPTQAEYGAPRGPRNGRPQTRTAIERLLHGAAPDAAAPAAARDGARRQPVEPSLIRAIIEGPPTGLRAGLAEACAMAGHACAFEKPQQITAKDVWLTLSGPPAANLDAAMDAIASIGGLVLSGRHPVKHYGNPALCAHVARPGEVTADNGALAEAV